VRSLLVTPTGGSRFVVLGERVLEVDDADLGAHRRRAEEPAAAADGVGLGEPEHPPPAACHARRVREMALRRAEIVEREAELEQLYTGSSGPAATAAPVAVDPFDLTTILAGPPPAVDWQWRIWVAVADLAMVAGDPGVGKSWLTLTLAYWHQTELNFATGEGREGAGVAAGPPSWTTQWRGCCWRSPRTGGSDARAPSGTPASGWSARSAWRNG
jgi:hypothetical protein